MSSTVTLRKTGCMCKMVQPNLFNMNWHECGAGGGWGANNGVNNHMSPNRCGWASPSVTMRMRTRRTGGILGRWSHCLHQLRTIATCGGTAPCTVLYCTVDCTGLYCTLYTRVQPDGNRRAPKLFYKLSVQPACQVPYITLQ